EEDWLDGAGGIIRTFTFTFDAASQLKTATDPDSAYTYGYDLAGRLTSVSNAGTPGAPTVAFAYTFDNGNNVTQRTDTINGQARGKNDYAYDELHRLTRIAQSGTGVTPKRVDLDYNTASQLTGVIRFADLAGTQLVASSAYTYDAAGRLTQLDHTRGSTTLAH